MVYKNGGKGPDIDANAGIDYLSKKGIRYLWQKATDIYTCANSS